MAASGNQREHGLGFGKPGQVMKIAVLTIRIMTVVVAQTLRRRRHDADRVASDDAHQLLAAAREFLAIDHWQGGNSGVGNGKSEKTPRAVAARPIIGSFAFPNP